ncbi:MAG TPA: HAMP domain-containing sensor histidine kinase [Acetivibrio clariflavus]|nr:HAMP domain-containing sensor histidine kinase [Acetivibrio clariflavus]
MGKRQVLDVYIRIVNILLITALLALNLCYFIESKEVNIGFRRTSFFVPIEYISLITVCLSLILLLLDITNLITSHYFYKKEKIQEKAKLIKYQKAIDVQYKLIEKIASLYDNTVKCTNEKSEFFYNMSHELKTPITVILGAIQLIEQNRVPLEYDRRKSSKHIVTIKQNCYRLLRLINNMLDLSRIESGYIKSNMVNCNIVYLIEEICQSVIPYSDQKSITLEFDTMEEEIITAVDVDKIERIILNLLSNAIKYTNKGGKISVVVSREGENVYISVKDTGIGIPKDKQKSVFERYQQVDSSLTKGIDGCGLGLSIVKSFVELHGGSIKVNSEPNMGSEFKISLPIKLVETTDCDTPKCVKDNQRRIIEAINIEFSDIYNIAAENPIKVVNSAAINR